MTRRSVWEIIKRCPIKKIDKKFEFLENHISSQLVLKKTKQKLSPWPDKKMATNFTKFQQRISKSLMRFLLNGQPLTNIVWTVLVLMRSEFLRTQKDDLKVDLVHVHPSSNTTCVNTWLEWPYGLDLPPCHRQHGTYPLHRNERGDAHNKPKIS